MAGQTINVDQLADEIMRSLEKFRDETQEAVETAVKKTAKETAAQINENAAALFKGTTYKNSWNYKKDPALKGKWRSTMIVHSKAPSYRVAHLLEKDHALRGGGRYTGRPHIEPAEREAVTTLVNYIEEGIKAI